MSKNKNTVTQRRTPKSGKTRKSKSKLTQPSAEMKWYANGFRPKKSMTKNNLSTAAKQTMPDIDVKRLTETSTTGDQPSHLSFEVEADQNPKLVGAICKVISENWIKILIEDYPPAPERAKKDGKKVNVDILANYRVIGCKAMDEAFCVWIYQTEAKILVCANFYAKKGVSWVNPPIFLFPKG